MSICCRHFFSIEVNIFPLKTTSTSLTTVSFLITVSETATNHFNFIVSNIVANTSALYKNIIMTSAFLDQSSGNDSSKVGSLKIDLKKIPACHTQSHSLHRTAIQPLIISRHSGKKGTKITQICRECSGMAPTHTADFSVFVSQHLAKPPFISLINKGPHIGTE